MSLEASAHKFFKIGYEHSALIDILIDLQTRMDSTSRRQIRTNSQVLILESKQIPVQSNDISFMMQELILNLYDVMEEPVRIEKIGNEEKLFYNSKKMETGKLYKITWNDQKLALRKSPEGSVDVYEFVPDKE